MAPKSSTTPAPTPNIEREGEVYNKYYENALEAMRRIITEPRSNLTQNIGHIWGNLMQARNETLESPFFKCKYHFLATCLDSAAPHRHLRRAETLFRTLKTTYPSHERDYINRLEKAIGRVRRTFLDPEPRQGQTKSQREDELAAERLDYARQYLESEAEEEMGESDEESRAEDAKDDWKEENWQDIPGVHDKE